MSKDKGPYLIIILIIISAIAIYLKKPVERVQRVIIKNNLEQLEKNIKEIDSKLDSLDMVRETIKEKIVFVKQNEEGKKNEVKNTNDNDSLITMFRNELFAN